MKVTIVLTALGTTTGAAESYSIIDKVCQEHFPEQGFSIPMLIKYLPVLINT